MIIVWRVVDSCNLACPFCAYDKRLTTPRRAADPARIERFLALLGRWRAATGRPVLLSWLGGEPLLWAPLDRLTALARAQGIDLSITTNGTTIGAARRRATLIRDYSEVTVSVDGFGDFHDAMRGWPGAFAKLRAGVTALARERRAAGSAMRLRANVVLMRGNIAAFPALCRELAGWGVDEISFNQLGGRDRPEFYPANRLQPADIVALRSMLPGLRAALAPSGTRIVGSPAYLDRIQGTVSGRKLPIADCRVAEGFLFIDEAGRIAPCSFTPDHFGLSVDTLESVADLDALGMRLNAAQRRGPSCDCADCPSTQQFAKFEPSLAA